MATTCELIAKNVLGSDTSSVSFTSIPSTYTDLVVVISARTDRASFNLDPIKLRFNAAGSDTDHSTRSLFGNGSGAFSSTSAYAIAGWATATTATSDVFGSSECYIPNYATAVKHSFSATGITENNATSARIEAGAGLWDSATAVTALEFLPTAGTNFVTGSSFYLYGITKA